jgi:hypothetical protein
MQRPYRWRCTPCLGGAKNDFSSQLFSMSTVYNYYEIYGKAVRVESKMTTQDF